MIKDFARKLITTLRIAPNAFRRRRRVAELRNQKPRIALGQIEAMLDRLPIPEGAVVLIHSSLKAIGFVDGGPQTVVRALVNSIVEKRRGTLLVPTYSIRGTMYNTLLQGAATARPVFAANSTKSNLGAIPETFRLWPGTVRSVHPTHSFSALGHLANELVDSHHRCGSTFGVGSPMANMLNHDGWLLGVGTNLGNVTMYHCLEEIEPDFPINVYTADSPLTVACRDADGGDHIMRVRAHDGNVSRTRIDRPENVTIREFFTRCFEQKAGMTWHQVGEARTWLISAARFYDEVARSMRDGVTIYTTEEQLEERGFTE